MRQNLARFSSQLKNGLKHNELLLAFVVGVTVIVMGVALGYENNKLIPTLPSPQAHYNLEPSNPLSFMANWDGPIYLNIAKHGYSDAGLANFFPLYPALIWIFHLLISSILDSALLVSWLAFIGAIYFYLKIVKELYNINDNLEALRATWFFVLFPSAYFMIATYTESLFAFLSLGAIYYAFKKKYIAAGLLVLLSTATHINGLFVLLLVAMIMLEEKVSLHKIDLTVIIGSLGFVAYITYLYSKFYSYTAFLHAQKSHSRINFSPLHILSEVATLDGLFLPLVAITAIYWWKRRKSFSVYTLLYLGIVLVGGKGFSGFARYSLVIFPLQLMLYDYLKDKKFAYPVVIALTSIFWCFFALHYVGGYTGG